MTTDKWILTVGVSIVKVELFINSTESDLMGG